VVGVVSEADLLHKMEFAGDKGPPKLFAGRARRRALVKSEADRAADLMSSPAVTVAAGAPLAAAAKLLDENNIKRLPVLDDAGRLLGIVSRVDLLRIYTRTDDQITEDIREGVLRQTLWVDPSGFDVQVAAGVVRLGGDVDSKSTATLIAQLCGGVAGVTEVHNELRWAFDDSKMTEPGYYRGHPFSGPR
jgi:predicted transcriptional regulator